MILVKNASSIGILWWTALVIAIVGILMRQGVISISQISSFWMMVISAGLFAVAALAKKA